VRDEKSKYPDFENRDGLTFELPVKPVSLQSSGQHKRRLRESLRKIFSRCPYLLSCDVAVEIIWYVLEQERYEAATVLDLDNIIKPLLDALAGPDGLLIDDGQIQSIAVSWLDVTMEPACPLEIRLRWSPGEFVTKDGLCFIELGDKLCLPFDKNLTDVVQLELIEWLEALWQARKKMQDLGAEYEVFRRFGPIQRYFHRNRLSKFEVVPKKTLQGRLGATSSH
jgi:Holliday junction resolvase RusA-like endonuclease